MNKNHIHPFARTYFVAGILVLLGIRVKSQDLPAIAVDTLNNKIENVITEIDLLKRLRVSGYIQAQWQLADTTGAVTPFSGGNFPKYSDNRFAIRRGRIKFTYVHEFATYELQLDGTEKGISIKDANVSLMEPWAQFATLTAGVFSRPFGCEIGYSSSIRETPERSRIFQTLFPGERDLGAKITLQPMKGTRYDFIKLEAGFFAGNGINAEFDSRKDFIGHFSVVKANRSETFKYGIGVSYYNGGVFQGTKYVYNPGILSDGKTFGFNVDSTASNRYAFAHRKYLGTDLQLSLFSGIGLSSIRAEYLVGSQPGAKSSNTSIASSTAPDYDIYNRKYSGGYVYFIQNIGQTKNQLVIKYDWFDPNTGVSGAAIIPKNEDGTSTGLSAADIRFTTLGLGWNYRFNSHIKFTTYYEIVKNELTGIAGTNSTNNYTNDLKDNIFTLRMQYRF